MVDTVWPGHQDYFPEEGKPGGEMTTLLENLAVGDQVDVKGPEGLITYTGAGTFEVMGHFFHCDKVNMIVGGTGITPALAVSKAVLLAKGDKASRAMVCLVFANTTFDDILCLEELESLASQFPDRFMAWHVISRAKEGERHPLASRLHFSTGQVAFVCGPPGFVAQAVMPALENLGFDYDQVFEF